MVNNNTEQILNYLRDCHLQNINLIVTPSQIADHLGIRTLYIRHLLRDMKSNGWIVPISMESGQTGYRITAKGLEKTKTLSESKPDVLNDDEKPLEFNVVHDDHSGKIKVFISHKFVESDQQLAHTLQKFLEQHNIYGQMAESTREYDLGWDDKIKRDIRNSDYLIAILTEKSLNAPSIHQEIGYAMGVKVPVRILVEENEIRGVFTEGKDTEKFSRSNFTKYLDNVVKNIVKKGIRKKISDEERQALLLNVYEPCYNKIMITYEKKGFFEHAQNPWKDISHAWKFRTELDIKEIFDEYTEQSDIWNKQFVNVENDFFHQDKTISDILKTAFARVDLLNSGEDIVLDQRSSMKVIDWFRKFRFVLFDTDISDSSQLYERMIEFAKLTPDAHVMWLEEFNKKTDLFREIMREMPSIRNSFDSRVSFSELKIFHQNLNESLVKLKSALENKLIS